MPALLERPQNRTTPAPQPGESQPAFAVRFHKAMVRSIPDTDRRERACAAAWDRYAAGRDDAERVAREKFPPDRYERIRRVAGFAAHVVVEDDGDRDVFDLNRLARIVEHNNDRICDVGLFSPLCEGHTPDAAARDRGAKEPPVLGYCGPFYLGMVGRKKPKWAIFWDEFHHRDDAEKCRKMTRRSVEIWPDGTIDPIAALGATTPQLAVGQVRYCRDARGNRVRKYSAAAFPAATSVAPPSFGKGDKPKRHSAENRAMAASLTDEDVAKIVNAVQQTQEMQWVRSQMGGSPDGVDGLGDAADDDDGPLDMGDDMGDDTDDAPADDMPADAAAPDAADASDAADVADMDDDEKREYAAMSGEGRRAYLKGRRRFRALPAFSRPKKLSRAAGGKTQVRQYARQADESHRKAATEGRIAQMERELAELRREKTEATRYARFEGLRSQGVVLDIEEEMEASADFSDEQFDRYYDRVAKKYARVPVGLSLPTPDLPELRKGTDPQKYSKERSERAKKIATRDGVTFEAALAQADKELGGAA